MKDLTKKQQEEVFELEDNIIDCVCDFDLEYFAKNFSKDKKVATSLRKMLNELTGYQTRLLSYYSVLDEIELKNKIISFTKKKNIKKKTVKKKV
tara:strand:+ start:186 stop:467 length:282 start_codon:yes stop_codon:yes gene_type:complete